MRFKNYINRYNKKNRIYSEEELLAMTLNELLDNEPSIMAQDGDIGIPSYEELKNSPNTRWIDSYIDENGQKSGGFYGSITPYDESIAPKTQIPPFVSNPHTPNFKSLEEAPVEAGKSPIVLEGGVEENVYWPDKEIDGQTHEPEINIPADDKNEKIETIEEKFKREGSKLIKGFTDKIQNKNNKLNLQILNNLENTDNINSTQAPIEDNILKNSQQINNVENLKKLYEELLEEIKRRLKMGKISSQVSNGAYTGGANSVKETYEEKIKPTKKDYLQGMFNDYKSLEDPVNTAFYVLGEFLTNFDNMKDANTKKADKYFHAKANYEAAQQGIVGSAIAKIISDLREWSDAYRNVHEKGYTKEESKIDIEEDQKANIEGRTLGRKYPTKPPYDVLEHLKPNGLPKRYQKRW